MGLHGNPVLNFPADFEDVNYFSITPLVNAGYTRGTESTISVIKHNITPNEIKDSNGNLVLTASFNKIPVTILDLIRRYIMLNDGYR